MTVSANMRKILEVLGYEDEDKILDDLIPRLAGAQKHRLELRNSHVKQVTRSTALVVLGQLDPAIAAGLRASGLEWEAFRSDLGLSRSIDAVQVDDCELHEDFRQALKLFLDMHTDQRKVSTGNLALAIAEMASKDETGKVGRRLRHCGADLALLPVTLAEAITPDGDTGVATLAFIGDAPKTDEDFLKRGDLAFVLAARLNRVWDKLNEEEGAQKPKDPQGNKESVGLWNRPVRRRRTAFEDGFVVHIDAPWGGGKTTFANHLSRILNPYRVPGPLPDWLAALPLDDTRFWPKGFRRPWHVVTYNAWRHQHVDPPWWVFYQAIRRQCFRAVRNEKIAAKEGKLPRPIPDYEYKGFLVRHYRWVALWVREIRWRVLNPKIYALLVTFVLTWIVAWVLYKFDLFVPNLLEKLSDPNGAGLPAVLTTGLVILLGGGTAVWSLFAAFTESLLPGTPDAAKNYSLGSGDPLDRFRSHFNGMIRSFRRPVIVIVDDIDRCEPKVVVEVVRGIQTILRSPRVVFVLLGDRDWIEHAFAHVHDAMTGIDVGPEHTFGGRFVEKAIQLSLVLPEITREGRTEYVQELLHVAAGRPREGVADLPETEQKNVAESLEKILEVQEPRDRDSRALSLRQRILDDESVERPVREAVARHIDRLLALRSAADEKTEKATRHRLVPIATVLPRNPRQIKRIINSISLFQEIARIEQQIQPGSTEWCTLALWTVLMTEWPRTWATLSTYPGLVDRVRSKDNDKGKTQISARLPSDELTKDWHTQIENNRPVMELFEFRSEEGNWAGAALTASAVEKFNGFMPALGIELLSKPVKEASSWVEKA